MARLEVKTVTQARAILNQLPMAINTLTYDDIANLTEKPIVGGNREINERLSSIRNAIAAANAFHKAAARFYFGR